MYDSVQTSLGKHFVAEDAVPVGYCQMAGQDQRFSVILVIYDLLEVGVAYQPVDSVFAATVQFALQQFEAVREREPVYLVSLVECLSA